MSCEALDRRDFLAGMATAALMAGTATAADVPTPVGKRPRRPDWRGFNLPPFFGTWNSGKPVEEDFQLVAELGFNFVRLPMWYTLWTEPGNWRATREAVLAEVDRAVEFAGKYGIHLNLCLHRAPGYCVAKEPREPFDLFKDAEAREAFQFHWRLLAQRYAGVSAAKLSFNLLNEPQGPKVAYGAIVREAVAMIRGISPERDIVVDGNFLARVPLPELAELGVIQSVHSYEPHVLTHYRASWVEGSERFPEPAWPLLRDGKPFYGRENLERYYAGWAALVQTGVPVHCGEMGCYNRSPHAVALAWMADVLGLLNTHGIGFALWELRGDFGVLDSNRSDVAYEDWRGHKLDRKMLALLQAH